jgi:hypothetical protein
MAPLRSVATVRSLALAVSSPFVPSSCEIKEKWPSPEPFENSKATTFAPLLFASPPLRVFA